MDLLQSLVRIPSVSGEEVACRDLLLAWLRARGVPAEASGRNVLARLEGGLGPGEGLLLCSHTDVVPVGPGWTRDPWDGAFEDGRVFGRGANDAKASVAAMAFAVAELDPARLAGRLVLALVCDEETGGEGLEALAPSLPAFSAAVIGEPTGLDVCPGQRGLLRARLVARGRACHASRPWEGENAIEKAARDVVRLTEIDLGEADPLLGPATLVSTVIHGGTRANVVPGECVVDLDGRTTPGCGNDEMLARIRSVAASDVEVKSRRFEPVRTRDDARILEVARGASPTGRVRGFGGVSDLYHVRHVPGVVMGPGTSDQSHAPDESVAVEQVRLAARAYREIVEAWLGAGGAGEDAR